MQVIVPIMNGGPFAGDLGMSVSLSSVGLQKTGLVRCDQPRTIDIDARSGRRVEAVPAHILEAVLAGVSSLFDPEMQ